LFSLKQLGIENIKTAHHSPVVAQLDSPTPPGEKQITPIGRGVRTTFGCINPAEFGDGSNLHFFPTWIDLREVTQ
jgi:hypothetical protein